MLHGFFAPGRAVQLADCAAPWHFLYFLPDPQGQGSLRPTFASFLLTGEGASFAGAENVRFRGCLGMSGITSFGGGA